MRTLALSSLALLLLATCAMAGDEDPAENALDTTLYTEWTQTQLNLRNYEDVNGEDAFGDNNRHGDENQGEGGAHGPLGPGPDEDVGAGSATETIVDFCIRMAAKMLPLR